MASERAIAPRLPLGALLCLGALACNAEPLDTAGAPGSTHDAASAARAIPTPDPEADASLRAAYIAARQAEADSSYDLQQDATPGHYTAVSRAARLATRFVDGAVHMLPAAEPAAAARADATDAGVELRLTRFGYASALAPLTTASASEVRANRIEHDRGALVEWYLNGPLGLEQGFDLVAPPARGEGELVLEVAVEGASVRATSEGQWIVLDRGEGRAALRYGELVVLDADGRAVPAQLTTAAHAIQIRVDDRDARYPLAIDPLVVVSETRLVPRTYGTEGTKMGHSVDVDGDLAVIGAPGLMNGADIVGAAYIFRRAGQRWSQEAVVTPNVAGSQFGHSVAIRGDTVAVGAYTEDASFGATYIYTKVGLAWVEQTRLTPPDPAPATTPRFGYALDLTDGELLVSAPGEGAAYLFEGAGASWSYTEKFAATGTATSNGPVAIDGDVVVVWRNVFQRDAASWSLAQTLPGIASEEPASVDVEGDTIALGFGLTSNVVHVYAKQGSQWAFDAPLTPVTAVDTRAFGFSVAVEGDLIAVGAKNADLPKFDAGGAFVFARGAGQWTQIAALGAPDGGQSDQLGQSIALSGGTLFVGSWAADSPEGLVNAGAAYVSEREGTGFSELVRVTPAFDGGDPNASIGSSVAMDADTIVLGAYRSSLQYNRAGAGYVFVRHPGSIWEQQGVLRASDEWPLQQLGESAAVNADTVILGAPDHRSPGTLPGAAYVFKRSGTLWTEEQKLLHDDPAAYDYFGHSVAVDGDTAAIGAPGKDLGTGAVYVFERSGTVWTQQQKLTASDAAPISDFGDAVALEGDTMVVGSPRADQAPQGGWTGQDFGALYVFTRSGTVWTEQVRLNGWQLPGALSLGDDVDIDGDVIAGVGYGRWVSGVKPTAYLYQGSGASWQQLVRVQPPSGRSIAVDGDLLLVDDYVYAPTNVARTAWQLQTTLTPTDTTGIGVFTNAVAVLGSTAVVCRGINVLADIQGAGFVFELADALANGSGCTTAGQCTSGYCVDGVCCDGPCDTQCQSCLQYAKADGSADGTCSQAATGVPCGPSGGCASSSEHELAPTCDAAGVCQSNVFTCQDGFACLGDSVTGRCVTDCTVNAQPDHSRCADDHYCDAGNCLPDKGVGGPCSIPEECLSGTCMNSVCLGEYGDPCDVASCAEGTCVDGYCCEETCSGKCEACGEPGFEGKCVEVTGAPRGSRTPCIAHPDCGGSCNGQDRNACAYPGNATACGTDSCVDGELTLNHCDGAGACAADAPASCSPYSDCADAQSCLSSCTGDAQCVNNHFCDGATNTCLPDRTRGATCSRNEQCLTGNCADGVCCNTECDKRCEACAETGQEGTCVAVVGMPRGSRAPCAGSGTPCEGQCDGGTRDTCSYPAGTSCGSSTCTNAVAYGALCDQGACVMNSSGQSCFPYTSCADGTQCLATCLSQSQCAAGYFCDLARSPAQCVQQQVDGSACDTAAQCLSGFCADGVCCNTECTGQCEACAESGSEGVCIAVSGTPRGARTACAGADDPDNVCAGACGGSRDKCAYPAAGSPCEDAACDGAVLTPARVCDGAGVCGLSSTQDCGAYGCDATDNRCNSRCDSRGDCAAGALCRLDVRECAFVPSVCIDGFTVELADGTQTSCDGHRCSAGDCEERCADDNDCASSYLCFERDCVPEGDVPVDAGVDASAQGAGRDASATTPEPDAAAPSADAGAPPTADVEPDAGSADDGGGDDSGCGCRVPGARRGPPPYPLLAAGAVLALGRRRRRKR